MMQQLAEFKKLFPEKEELPFDHYLKGISKNTLLRIATYLIGRDIYTEHEENIIDTLRNWFSGINKHFANDIAKKIMQYQEVNRRNLQIVNTISCLQILQIGLQIVDEEEAVAQSPEESEISLFYAMLTLNGIVDSKQTRDQKKIAELYPNNYLGGLLMNYSFATHDIINFNFTDYTACQVIKSLLLFRFLEASGEGNLLLDRFYKYYNVKNWQEYHGRVLPLIVAWANNETASSVDIVLNANDSFEESRAFLEKFAMGDYGKESDYDYKRLRDKPLLRLDEKTYRIIHPLFVADKIYKGLYFLLSSLNSNGDKIVKGDFRSWYTTNFSEENCFIKLIEYSITYRSVLAFDRDFKTDGAPDGYVRIQNDIFIFENKDVYLNAEIKQSYDAVKLDDALKLKFLIEPQRVVGIGQIINNIVRTSLKHHLIDQSYNYNEVTVYPILMIHDRMFETPGVNEVLNCYFQLELEKIKAKGIEITRVKPLTVINIDTLCEIGTVLRRQQANLSELLEAYFRHQQIPPAYHFRTEQEFHSAVTDSKISFSDYVVNYLNNKFRKGWRTRELMDSLFNTAK